MNRDSSFHRWIAALLSVAMSAAIRPDYAEQEAASVDRTDSVPAQASVQKAASPMCAFDEITHPVPDYSPDGDEASWNPVLGR